MCSGSGARGYVVNLKRDSKDIVRGYTVGKGNSVYKSSQLGSGRNLTPSKIEQTWENLHPVEQPAATKAVGYSEAVAAQETVPQQTSQSTGQPVTNAAAQPTVQPNHIVHYDIEVADKHYRVDIPKAADSAIADILSLADAEEFAAGILEMQKTAVLLFAGYVDAATAMSESHGGGGSAPLSPNNAATSNPAPASGSQNLPFTPCYGYSSRHSATPSSRLATICQCCSGSECPLDDTDYNLCRLIPAILTD